MEKIKNFSVLAGKNILASLIAFAIFGLALALAWTLPFSENPAYKLTTALVSAGLAFFAGGYLMGKISNNPSWRAAEWGLFIGFFAFGYLFGLDWKWPVAGILCGIFAALGGWTSQAKLYSYRSSNEPDHNSRSNRRL